MPDPKWVCTHPECSEVAHGDEWKKMHEEETGHWMRPFTENDRRQKAPVRRDQDESRPELGL